MKLQLITSALLMMISQLTPAAQSVDLRNSMSTELQNHFYNLDQSNTGFCYAASASLLLSAEVGRPVSLYHLAFDYNSDLGILSKIFRDLTSDKVSGTYQGGFTDILITDAINRRFACPAVPAESDPAGFNARTALAFIVELRRMMTEEPQKDIAEMWLAFSPTISKLIPNISLEEFQKVAQNQQGANTDLFLSKLLKLSCSENQIILPKLKVKTLLKRSDATDNSGKVKREIPGNYKAFNKTILSSLNRGKPIAFSYFLKRVTSNLVSASSLSAHESTIVGYQRNSSNDELIYIVQNSWGNNLTSKYFYDSDFVTYEYGKGSYLMSAKNLFKIAIQLQWLEK